jgi:hypothetical protein
MFKFYFILFFFYSVNGSLDWSKDMNGMKWRLEANNNIQKRLNRKANRNIAKNLILFIGDGKRNIFINKNYFILINFRHGYKYCYSRTYFERSKEK